jgi:hypothetical protein
MELEAPAGAHHAHDRADRPREGQAGAPGTGFRSSLGPALALVFLVAAVASFCGIGVRATFGAHVAVDEPQYLMTALSLAEDRSLDISDELAEQRWRPFADTGPPTQTQVRTDGRQLSPHDVLLPLLLAVPMGLGGWIAAKVTLALLAGALAALVLWTAVRRLAVPARVAVPGVGLAFASAPLAVYGQQVYPELPAALAVMVAGSALLGPLRRGSLLAVGLAVTALPWLGVKYAPVAAALAGVTLYRLARERRLPAAAGLAAGLALMGAGYLAVHRMVWGGWTVYASGDHFQDSGEFGVVGFQPDYVGRGLRLVALLADRGYGIAAWQPAWLLLLPAAAVLVRSRARGGLTLAVPLLAGWLTATFIAVTMHGFWSPGRQLVVVLPLALLVILTALAGLPAWTRRLALGLGVSGVLAYAWLVGDGLAGRLTWVTGFENVGYPGYRLLRPLLPDYRDPAGFWDGFGPTHLAWIVAFAALVAAGWFLALRRPQPGRGPAPPPSRSAVEGLPPLALTAPSSPPSIPEGNRS